VRVVIAAVLVTSVLSGTSSDAGAASTATVPVVVCPTSVSTYAPPTPVASSARVPASAAHLVVYSTTNAYVQILGPKGMACNGDIGGDGAGGITVARPYDGQLAHGGVAAEVEPTCVGCLLTMACPFFPAAMKAARQDGFRCPAQPRGQKTHRLSPSAVAFYDPSEEHIASYSAGLAPSDSPYPTNGLAVYTRTSVAMEAVCVLPASEHGVCTTVLDYFLATQARKWSG
jgi:hypothetical protein